MLTSYPATQVQNKWFSSTFLLQNDISDYEIHTVSPQDKFLVIETNISKHKFQNDISDDEVNTVSHEDKLLLSLFNKTNISKHKFHFNGDLKTSLMLLSAVKTTISNLLNLLTSTKMKKFCTPKIR